MKEDFQALKDLIGSSGVDFWMILKWQEAFYKGFQKLTASIPLGHVWRVGKFAHALNSEEAFKDIAPNMGFEKVEIDVIGFAVLAHDIGRLCQAIRQSKGIIQPWPHGTDSVMILRDRLKITDDSLL